MGKKKREGVTTNIRYKGKAYSVGFGVFHGNEEFSKEYAEALATARAKGIGVFANAYQEILPVLSKDNVPSAFYGLYKAFANELIAKVQRRKINTVTEIVDKWVKMGLDAGVLNDCVAVIGEVMVTGPPEPAPK